MVKPATKDIASYLAQPRKSMGMLLYGPDLGLVRQRVLQLTSVLLPNANDPFGRIELSAEQLEDDPARLHDELSAFSFTGEPRLLVLRDVGDSHSKLIEPALSALSATTYLLMFAGDLPGKSSLRALVEKHAALVAIPCYKDEGSGLEQLIRSTFTGYGIQAPPDVVRYLCTALGGDRMIILNEIEKISLYLGDEEERISLDTVMKLVADNSDRGQDELNHAVASGNSGEACRLLDKLLAEGAQSVAIVRGLQYYFQRLYGLHLEQQVNGGSIEAIIDAQRPPVFFKLKPLLVAHAKRWNATQIRRVLDRMLSLEVEVKRYHDQAPARLGQAILGISRAVR